MFKQNPLLNLDSYKLGHINMYPEGVTEVYSNLTPRSTKRFNCPEKYKEDEIVWFGGQAAVVKMVQMFDEHFFSLTKHQVVEFARQFAEKVAPFTGGNYDTKHILALHRLGYLPLSIQQLPEGSIVNSKVPVMTIRNTHPNFYWLTNWLETWLSNETWHASTSATTAYHYRKIGEYWYEKTGANKAFLDFAFHDFSLRGQTSMDSGITSGACHLSSFLGSDTVPAVDWVQYYYGCEGLVAASVPATEHSIQTAFLENDYEYIKHMITKTVPSGIVSVVADGYDYWNVLTDVIPSLKQEILNRPVNELGMSKVVIRPDSGDPVRIICGYDESEYDYIEIVSYLKPGRWTKKDGYKTPEEIKGSIEVLWDIFGGTINEKGYKVLDSHIGLIYGDSITMERAEEIFKRLEAKGFSAENVVFGIGSYTYQMVTRDTLGFAVKATNIVKDGVSIPLFKTQKQMMVRRNQLKVC